MVTPTTPQRPGPNSNPPSSADLVFGRYQIIRRLAVGGMGEVFLARQSGVAGFDRLVILKSLLPDLAAQEDFVNQFLDEARVAATLNHPNIVSIYEVGLWNGTYFIAMEYIRGDNLSRLQRGADRMKRPIPIDVAALVVHDAALALDHAHRATDLHGKPLHIVHRDVSPQNIMVRTDGHTKVVDFGIAKAANRSSRTATGLLKGKVQYMAPEQVQGMELDGRADQFALGVVLWEMCAGKKLFQGGNDIDILRAVVQGAIPRLVDVNPRVAPQLSAIVERMLAREREARYPTLADAAHDLKGFLDVEGMKNAETNTALFVADVLGEEISAKTVDLTPSSGNNFVINLAQSSPPPTSPTAVPSQQPGNGRAKLGIAAGLTIALALAASTAVIMFGPADAPQTGATVVPAGANPRVVVESQPAGATVKIDDAEVGKAPLEKAITPDVEHKIEVVSAGFAPKIYTLKLGRGEAKPLYAVLEKLKSSVKIVTTPSGAEVKVGGKSVGKSPVEVKELEADVEHDIVAVSGALSARMSITLKPGEAAERELKLTKTPVKLKPSPAPAPPPPPVAAAPRQNGFLTLKTTPWAKITIDGQPMGSTPVHKIPLAPGPHTLLLVNDEQGVNVTKKIVIQPGELLKQDLKLK